MTDRVSDPAGPAGRPLDVALLAFPEATASVLFGLHDLFHSAGRDWGLVVNGVPGPALMVPRIVTADGGPLAIANGVRIEPDASLANTPTPDLVCIPELLVAPSDSLEGRFAAEIDWIRAAYSSGAIVAAACSGSLLLAQAGLLDGQDATTHWAYCAALAARHPRVRVHPQRSLVAAGIGQRLVMAGGGTSWQDLGLYLIARLVGIEPAMQLARVYLIDWHHGGQQPFARLSASRQSDDAEVTRCQLWIAEHYAEPRPVAALAQLSGLSERSLARRFRRATGLSPLDYVHIVRLEEAKQMLEATDLPIDAIAGETGYEDASFFSRLFKRKVGMTPALYRRRFGSLRTVLRAAGAAGAVDRSLM